jgi:hypothetical protein
MGCRRRGAVAGCAAINAGSRDIPPIADTADKQMTRPQIHVPPRSAKKSSLDAGDWPHSLWSFEQQDRAGLNHPTGFPRSRGCDGTPEINAGAGYPH